MLGSFSLPVFLLAVALVPSQIDERLAFGLLLIAVIPLGLYVDALVLRKTSLPRLVQKWLGHRAAWFASPAPTAPDSIGNADRKYAYKLTNWRRS
ncbi:MAG: hypothetical protein ACXW4U_16970 [Anaerolineales bacterium]